VVRLFQDSLGQNIELANVSNAKKAKRLLILDLDMVTQNSKVTDEKIKEKIKIQLAKVQAFVNLFEKNKKLFDSGKILEINLVTKTHFDTLIVQESINDVYELLTASKPLKSYFDGLTKEQYRLSSILKIQSHLISAIEKVSQIYIDGKAMKNTDAILDALFIKLDSWTQAEEALI
jgi:hypothetical protein